MEEKQRLRAPKEREGEPHEEKPLKKLGSSLNSSGVGEASAEEKSCQSETLVAKTSGEFDRSSNCGELDVKPVIATPLASFDPVEYKVAQLGMSHQEVFTSVKAKAQAHKKIQNECTPSPVPLKPSVSSAISPSPLQQSPSTLENDSNKRKPETELDNSSEQEVKSTHFTVTPTNDGYNWRKYGEKLVKNSRSSRSYYRCTTSNCQAKKKVEKCDVSGNLIEITYRGRHNHDPPQKIRRTKERKSVSSAGPGGGSGLIDCPVKQLIDSDPSRSQREARRATLEHQLSAKQCDQANSIKSDRDNLDEPHSKRRMKGTSLADPVSMFKHVKEPKIVVQAASDVGTSGDGYRWRKYGQKMVKGSPNPRSYYKCTSAGCPVRKHVERATDDATAMVITYEGQHDHDMPVLKKRHGPPSAALLIAAAAAMNSAQLKKPGTLANHKISAQWSMDMDSRLENKKVPEPESARTLLSIGIELRPC